MPRKANHDDEPKIRETPFTENEIAKFELLKRKKNPGNPKWYKPPTLPRQFKFVPGLPPVIPPQAKCTVQSKPSTTFLYCRGGPFKGETLELCNENDVTTLPFLWHGEIGRYQGGDWRVIKTADELAQDRQRREEIMSNSMTIGKAKRRRKEPQTETDKAREQYAAEHADDYQRAAENIAAHQRQLAELDADAAALAEDAAQDAARPAQAPQVRPWRAAPAQAPQDAPQAAPTPQAQDAGHDEVMVRAQARRAAQAQARAARVAAAQADAAARMAQAERDADALRRLDELAQVRRPAELAPPLAFPIESAPDFMREARHAQHH
jgi:hypothetical protein